MPFFNPMRDYYHRQQAKRLGQLGADLQVVIELTESCCGTSIFPGSNTLARIEHEGQPIGEVHYGVNPLADRLYINMIPPHLPISRLGHSDALAAVATTPSADRAFISTRRLNIFLGSCT